MNIGMDFGSTYSILSRYSEKLKGPEAFEDQVDNTVTIPTMVSVDDMGVEIGNTAKSMTGEIDVRTFKAFKMLLTDSDEKRLEKRHFDLKYSPKWATQEFIGNLVKRSQDFFGDNKIDHMVVGAPDVWFHQFSTLSGRAVVHDICAEIDGVEKVTIVSEPVLASAYFAHNFKKKQGEPFDGSILIIDYGGGTLDLSLTKINSISGSSAQIKMSGSNGAGENSGDEIGNAGIVYMESLMAYAIRKENPEEADDIIGSDDFLKAVNILEKYLISKANDIKEAIADDVLYPEDLESRSLKFKIRCRNKAYIITMADLVEVYNDVIRPVFDEKMDEMIEWADKKCGIDVFDKNSDKFKIELVGGFGNFHLVRQQMYEKFEISDDSSDELDNRRQSIINSVKDGERAISYGASLIASGLFTICDTAPYSIGLLGNGVKEGNYMVHHMEEIDLHQPYFIQEYGEDKKFSCGGDWIDKFFIDYGMANPKEILFGPKPEFKKKLKAIIKNPFAEYAIGVSFDESEMMTLHLREYVYDLDKNDYVLSNQYKEELGELNTVFEEIK